MLRTENTNMNMSGVIHTDDLDIATVSGNFNGGEDFYMHISVPAYTAALDNKEVFMADLKTFIEQMLESIVDLKN